MIQSVDQNVGVDVRRRMANLLNVRLADDVVFPNQWPGKEGATAFTARDHRTLIITLLE